MAAPGSQLRCLLYSEHSKTVTSLGNPVLLRQKADLASDLGLVLNRYV